MRKVVIAVFPGVQALDVAGPLDVFSIANDFLPCDEHYQVMVTSATGQAVRASNGMQLLADTSFDDASSPWDIALVAGGPRMPFEDVSEPLVKWLSEVARISRRYGSICNGAFALGAAGLLDDHEVTTHWKDAPLLAKRFPKARVQPDRLFCRDGGLLTSAGITAGIDLALALVREDHGPAVALATAKQLVVFSQRQGGQSQFSPFLASTEGEDEPFARVQKHVTDHLREDLSVARLSGVAGMSARTFARAFVQWAGVTPHEFVERARVDVARNLLESTARPLKTVAWRCGFTSAERMRQVFVKRIGVSPAQYRDSFGRCEPMSAETTEG